MTSEYRPIACDQYSILELLVIRRTRVDAEFVDESGGLSSLSGSMIDLYSRSGAEYLLMRDARGVDQPLRLDRLRLLRRGDGAEVWRRTLEESQ